MFEAQAAYYLNKYLGKYVDGVDPKSLRISVWAGNVVLTNLRIRPEALEELNLPITVKAGLLGTLRLKVPWNKLGKEPVIVEIDKLYLLAGPFEEYSKFGSEKELNEWIQFVENRETDAKCRRVKEKELDWIQKRQSSDDKSNQESEDKSGGYLQYYIDTILGNLELRITNVHVRYEDSQTSPGCTFAMGLTFHELSAHTVDENGARAFINAKEMESIRKHVTLGSLSMYFDANSELWYPTNNWSKCGVQSWDAFFIEKIRQDISVSPWIYLLKPVDGTLMYLRRRQIGKKKRPDDVPQQEVYINLKEIGVQVSRKQYEHVQNMLTLVNLYQLSLPHRHFRPPCRPVNSRSRRLWWTYAVKGVRLSILGSLSSANQFCRLIKTRMEYVPAYVNHLEHGKVGGDEIIREMDKNLEETTILVFRHLAHLKFEQSARRKAIEKAASRPATWSEWFWGSSAAQSSQKIPGGSMEQFAISEAEWEKLNSLLGVHDDDNDDSDNPWTMKNQFSVLVESCAFSMTDKADKWVLYGACSHIVAVNQIYPETNSVEFSIVAGTLSCPSGIIASTKSTGQDLVVDAPRALSLEYIRKPQDRPVDAVVKLKCTCTFITYYASALQSVLSFFEPVAQADFSVLEAQAAAGLQRARKKAEKQLMEILEEDRELYDITVEMDAPKLAIPRQNASRDFEECTVILDLGQLKLKTDRDGKGKLAREEALAYECLHVEISDVAIFMVDGVFKWPELVSIDSENTSSELEKLLSESSTLIPVLERCGAQSDIQIARGRRNGLTPVRLTFGVPHIGFHVSPAVYARGMNILDSLAKKLDISSSNRMDLPEEITFEASAKLLIWEGLGGSNPVWKTHRIFLKRDRLCVCKTKDLKDVVRWTRLGEDIQLIPLALEDSLGKADVVAVASAFLDPSSLALEDSRTIVLSMQSEAEKGQFLHAVEIAKRKLAMLTNEKTFESVAESIGIHEKDVEDNQSHSFVDAKGSIDELLVIIAGRPPAPEYCAKGLQTEHFAGMVDGEVPLIILSQEKGRLCFYATKSGLFIDLSVNQFAIEDCLLGQEESQRYMAQSVDSGDDYAHLTYKLHYDVDESQKLPKIELLLDFSALKCECHRPTIAALLAMGLDISDYLAEKDRAEMQVQPSGDISDLSTAPSEASLVSIPSISVDKQIILFHISLSMTKLELAFNYEDSSTENVALVIAENFRYDLDVHTSTIHFTSSLGNMLVYDGALPKESPHRQICGLKSQAQESFINIDFKSHTISESFTNSRVPSGVLFYSLRASISAVELVYFNRWLQEFLFYIFVMLGMTPPRSSMLSSNPPDSPENTSPGATGKDKSTDLSPTLVLLDIDLDAPVVNMPKTSDGTDFIAIDFGHIEVSNAIQWFGRSGHRFLADNILVKCFDLSGKVCKDSILGPNMIQDLGEGLNIRVWRNLNDPFKSVPMYQVWVDIPTIHCSVSDEEYESLVSIVLENLRGYTLIPDKALSLTQLFFPEVCEMQTPIVAEDYRSGPPQLKRLSSSISRISTSSKEQKRSSTRIEAKTKSTSVQMKINLDIKSAQLTLTNVNKSGGLPIPLGRLQLVSFQLTYRSIIGGDMSVHMSIPTIEIVDVRPNQRKHYPVVVSSSQQCSTSELLKSEHQSGSLTPSLIVLNYEVQGEQQLLTVRLQRPTIRIELDQKLGFLLAITDFAFPSFSLGVKLNKEFCTRDLILGKEVYNATSDIWISPEVRVLADLPGQSEFVFNGNGHQLILPSNVGLHESLPLILVGAGATLTLTNVKIVNSSSLASIVQIQPGGQLLLSDEGNMASTERNDGLAMLPPRRTLRSRISGLSKSKHESASHFFFTTNISAIGVSMRVIDKHHSPQEVSSDSPVQQSLAATLDCGALFKIMDDQYNAEAELRNLMIESTATFGVVNSQESHSDAGREVSSRVLEPCDATLEYTASPQNTQFNAALGQIVINVAPDLLHVLSAFESLFLTPINTPSLNQPLVSLSNYQKIWSSKSTDNGMNAETPVSVASEPGQGKTCISFWRPRAPAGYGITGDVVTSSQQQCHHQVHAIALNSGLAANPVGFRKIWEDGSEVALWYPEAPDDYVALGCFATTDNMPPATTLCLCLHRSTLVAASLGECVQSESVECLWSVDNSFRTIVIGSLDFERPAGPFFELRSPLGISPKALSHISSTSNTSVSFQCYQKFAETQRKMIIDHSTRRLVLSTSEFEKIWVDKDCQNGMGAGIWRPKAPQGYSITGDCLEVGSGAPPKAAAVIFDSKLSDFRGSQLLMKPKGYSLIWQDTQGRKEKRLAVYRPIPESGYVAMGYVAVVGKNPPSVDLVRCVNLEAVSHMGYSNPIPDAVFKWNRRNLCVWVTDNESKNFVTSTLSDQPPTGDMWRLSLPQDNPQMGHTSESKEGQLDFKFHTGPVNIQVRDSRKLPILEIELHHLVAVASCQGPVMKSYMSFNIALWSYNSMLKAWEPVLEKASLLLHYDQNSSAVAKDGASPGSQLRISSTGETVHFTLAYTALESIMNQYEAFMSLNENDSSVSTRSVQNTDAATMEITFINLLGCPAYFLSNYGHEKKCFMLDTNARQQVRQSLPFPPQRHDQSLANIYGKKYLVLGLLRLEMNLTRGKESLSLSSIHCELSTNEESSHCMRTCAYAMKEESIIAINEQFVIDVPQDHSLMSVTLKIVETTLSSYGDCIMSGLLNVKHLLEISADCPSAEVALQMDNPNAPHSGNFIISVSTEQSKGSLFRQCRKEDHQGDRALRLHPSDNWVEIPGTGVQIPSRGCAQSALDFDMPSLAVGVKVGAGLVMQTGYRGARQESVLRSLCKFVNSTETTLQVQLVERNSASLLSKESLSSIEMSAGLQDSLIAEEEVYENERKNAMGHFSHENLLFTDRKRFSRKSTGAQNSSQFPNIELESGWEWLGPWEIEKIGNVDANGWCYAPDFKMMKYPCKKGAHKRNIIDFTRRRRWVRKRRQKQTQVEQESSTQGKSLRLGTVLPGCSLPLPIKWNQGLWALQARPIFDQKSYHHWSHLVTEDETGGLDLSHLSQGRRRMGLCQILSKMSSRKDLPQPLLCSSQFWVSFLVEGVKLPAPMGMEALTDWTITAHPPLVIHNVLPFGGHFMLWEKQQSGSVLSIREQGQIKAEEKYLVHGADMRNEVCLSFYPEECDFNENEPVTISRGYSEQAAGIHGNQQLPPSFRVIKNGHITRVMMERELDVGASHIGKNLDPGVAVAQGYPLVVRLYVPLWVVNNTEVAINIGLATLHTPLGDQDEGNGDADSNNIQSVTTTPNQRSPFSAFTMCVVSPHNTEIFSYQSGGEARLGVKMMVLGSGWSPPIPLQAGELSGAPSSDSSSTSEKVVKQLTSGGYTGNRMIIWAEVPEVNTLVPVAAYLDHAASGFIRTKVLILEPHILVSNQSGVDIALRPPPHSSQVAAASSDVIREVPAGTSCNPLKWILQSGSKAVCAQARAHGSQWSTVFRVQYPLVGNIHVCLDHFNVNGLQALVPPTSCLKATSEASNKAALNIQVSILRPGCLHVNFLCVGGRPPYTIENNTLYPFLFRQQGVQDQWNLLPPLSAQGWVLPKVDKDQLVVEFHDAANDKIGSASQFLSLKATSGGSTNQILTLGDGSAQGVLEVAEVDEVCTYRPLMSFNSAVQTWGSGMVLRVLQDSVNDEQSSSLAPDHESPSAFKFNIKIAALSVSLVDQTPEELLLLSIDGVNLEVCTGMGSRGRFSHAELLVKNIQLDNQLSDDIYPVLATEWRKRTKNKDGPNAIYFKVVQESGMRQGHLKYPMIAFRLGDLQVAIHENVIWRVHSMVELIRSSLPTADVQGSGSDVGLEIGHLQLNGLKTKISVCTDPTSRPRFSQPISLGLEFANVEDVEMEIKGYEAEQLSMPQSVFQKQIIAHLRSQAAGIVLSLLDFYFSVGGVSQALSVVGKAIQTAVDDNSAGSSRKITNKVDSFHDGLVEGTTALGKGLFNGLSGFVRKPIRGAREDGFTGFIEGAAKGIAGVALTPISGVFEAASKVTEGLDVLTSRADDVPVRRRLPLSIRGDGILRPFNKMEAGYQLLLQSALLSKGNGEREAYEGHRLLESDRMVIWTKKRLVLLRGSGLQEWQFLLHTDNKPAVHPSTKVIWWLNWDNTLSVNVEQQTRGEKQGLVVVYAKHQVSSFQHNFRCALKSDPEICNANALCGELWESMVKYTHLGTRSQDAGNMVMPEAPQPRQLDCTDFQLVWKSHGGFPVAVWSPKCPPGYVSLGQVIGKKGIPTSVPVFWDDSSNSMGSEPPILARPSRFVLIFRDDNPRTGKLTIWNPVAPAGYKSLGSLIVADLDRPSRDEFKCLREDLCMQTQFNDISVWRGGSSDIDDAHCSLWSKQGDQYNSFHAVQGIQKPAQKQPLIPAPNLGHSLL